jgi:pimeloyl-ACP methyl ester carboxylesterase
MTKLILWVSATLCLVIFTGCTTPNYQAFVNEYEREYSDANHPVVHAVSRSDGLIINAREFGLANKGHGPTIVMMHGFPDNQHLYDLLIVPLAKTRHVITFDFLGWGHSDKPIGHRYDVASLRTDLEAVVKSFNLESVVVVAHDLSGQPSIDWALDNEDRVAALVLLNTYYSPMAGLKPPEAIARFSTPGIWRDLSVWGATRNDAMWQNGVEEQISKFFVNQSARETFVKIFVHQSLEIRPAFFGENDVLLDEVARRSQVVPRLKHFHKPVRIIFGTDDPYLNASVANEFQQLFPGSEKFLIKSAAHYVQLDQPNQVAQIIMSARVP